MTFEAGAQYTGVSTRTLQNWEQQGAFRAANIILPGSTRGRRLIERASLDSFLESFIGAPSADLVMNSNREVSKS